MTCSELAHKLAVSYVELNKQGVNPAEFTEAYLEAFKEIKKVLDDQPAPTAHTEKSWLY